MSDHARSLAGETNDDPLSMRMGTTSCWTCGYRDCEFEIEKCERAGAGVLGCPHGQMAGEVER